MELIDCAERVDGLAVVQLDGGRSPEPEVFGCVGGRFFGRTGQTGSNLVHEQRVGARRDQELVLELGQTKLGRFVKTKFKFFGFKTV